MKYKISFKNIVVLALAAGIITITIVTAVKKNNDVTVEMPTGWEVQSLNEYMKTKRDTPSDIEGMSQYDKYKMGLNYEDGSDSDFDGLTDKEEIEVYNTDPLKASTSGDLYTDGYKVQQGMDLLAPQEYDQEITFEYNQCPEINLEANSPTDFYAVVEECPDNLADFGIDETYAGYSIYNYDGPLTMDLTEILAKNNISLSDAHIWIAEGDFLVNGASDLQEVQYKNNGNQITVDYDMNDKESYLVFVAGPKQKLTVGSGLFGEDIENENIIGDEEYIWIFYEYPIMQLMTGKDDAIIEYSEMSSEKTKTILSTKMNEWINNTSGDIVKKAKKIEKTKAFVKMKSDFLNEFLPIFTVPEGKGTLETVIRAIPCIFFHYTIFTDNVSANDNNDRIISAELNASGELGEDRDSNSNRHTDFDKYTDELPFQNFKSDIGETGNCAGIAHLTSYLYNNGSFPSTGSYDEIVWDLGTDPENSTLTDKGLSDYKNSSFVNDHSNANSDYINTGLSNGEKEFVNMIGSYWKEGNDKVLLEEHLKEYSVENDFSVIEKAMNYIDQGKIVDAYMLFKAGYGHAVNLYDYFYTDAGEIIFRVYDSNIPQDNRGGVELNHAFCYLHVKEKVNPNGQNSFVYLYCPIKNNTTYMATSVHNLMNENALVIMDENWNVF